MRATLDDALHFVRSMSPRARQHGYVLAPFGSTVLHGQGRDVDVMAAPWRDAADYGRLLSDFAVFGWAEQGERYFGLMGTCAVLLRPRGGGPDIDLQIREVPRTDDIWRKIRRTMEMDAAGGPVSDWDHRGVNTPLDFFKPVR